MSISCLMSQLLLLNLGGIYSHLEAFPAVIPLLDLPEEALRGSPSLSLLRPVTTVQYCPSSEGNAKICCSDFDASSFLSPLLPVLPLAVSWLADSRGFCFPGFLQL